VFFPFRFPRILLVCLPLLAPGCATAPPITKLYGGQRIVTRSVDPNAYEHAARAMLYIEQEQFTEAAAELKRALIFDEKSPELHARLGDVYVSLERYKDAAAEIETSLGIEPLSDAYLAKAHLFRAQSDFAAAYSALREAKRLVDFRDRAELAMEIYLALAEAQIEHLDLPAARATLEEACGSLPQAETAQLKRMAIAWAAGDMPEARRPLRQTLEDEPNQIDAWLALAWIESAEGRGKEATTAFKEALERSEGAFEVAAAYARYLVGTGAAAGAAELADELSVPLPSVTKESLLGRIELERSARRIDRALALVAHGQTLAFSTEEKARLFLLEAGLRKEANEIEKAITVLLSVGKDSSVHLESRLRAAELLRDTGRGKEAKDRVEQAAGEAKDTLDVVVSLALSEEKTGNAARAIERLGVFLRAHPGNLRANLALAMIRERQGDAKGALDQLEPVIAKNPGSVEVLNFWGFVAADHGLSLDLAKKRIEAAVALEPGSGGMLDSLGWVYFRLGDFAKAALFLGQAGRLEPGDAEIQFHLGELAIGRGDRDQAQTRFRRALTLSPDDRLRRKIEARLSQLGQPKTP
jgi:Tfp pilus assembly protein PilF